MAAGRVEVYLDNAAIGRLSMPGGMIYEYVTSITTEVLNVAFATAPVLTGKMRSTLRRGGGAWNQYGCSERVFVGTDYAQYVLHGTTGPIRSPRGKLLTVGASQAGFGAAPRRTLAASVDGQVANNFLGAALSRVMRARGL